MTRNSCSWLAAILAAVLLIVPVGGERALARVLPAREAAPSNVLAAATPDGRWIASFRGAGNAYAGRPLYLRDRATGQTFVAGPADPYIRPVLSASGRWMLYVTVRSAHAFPGARWSLWRYDRQTNRSRLITSALGFSLTPLGWVGGHPYFTIARESSTDINVVVGGKARYISYLFTQPISEPSLSPDGRYIAFTTPSDCAWCTLSIYDLQTQHSWFGPTGVPDEHDVAWTAGGRALVTVLTGKLAVIDAGTHALRRYRLPAGLPLRWPHTMRASLTDNTVRLLDLVTRQSYVARPLPGH